MENAKWPVRGFEGKVCRDRARPVPTEEKLLKCQILPYTVHLKPEFILKPEPVKSA